jgi:anaerobic magnesium-protoporphyrin IX monomethyl ester cyclase
MPTVAIRMPNGALTSLAGNVDQITEWPSPISFYASGTVRETVTRLVREIDPELVGLSVMTFQRRTAGRIIELIRSLKPNAKIVVGGYDPSLAFEAYLSMPVDFIVRGEGEVTFRELMRALDGRCDMHFISGPSHRCGDRWIHNQQRAPHRLENDEIRLPDRSARVLKGYTILGRQADVVETSRGCTYDCSFCSIIEMRGRNFHTYSLDRNHRHL